MRPTTGWGIGMGLIILLSSAHGSTARARRHHRRLPGRGRALSGDTLSLSHGAAQTTADDLWDARWAPAPARGQCSGQDPLASACRMSGSTDGGPDRCPTRPSRPPRPPPPHGCAPALHMPLARRPRWGPGDPGLPRSPARPRGTAPGHGSRLPRAPAALGGAPPAW